MTPVRITRARRWEASALARILWDFGDETSWLPRVRSRMEEVRLVRRMVRQGWVHVARRGGRTLGFIAAGEGEIHALYLVPEARGQGVGQALITHAQARSPKLGLWTHAANHPARRFYTAAGFRAMGVGAANDERMTEIRFEWEGAA